MNFACIVQLNDGLYLGSDLKEVTRDKAPIEKHDAAVARARRRFGPSWGEHCKVVEVEYSEFMGAIGSKGGAKVTPKKLHHLRTLHKRNDGETKAWRVSFRKQDYFVISSSINKAVALMGRGKVDIARRTFIYNCKRLKRVPWSGGDPRYLGTHGVWFKNGKDWIQLA